MTRGTEFFGGIAGSLRHAVLAIGLVSSVVPAFAEDPSTLGHVNTSFHIFGSHNVTVTSFSDPALPVVCYLSHAETGGIKGAVGVAKNPTRFSLACVKSGTDPLNAASLPKNENISKMRNSFFFKKLVITRMVDADHRAVVYLVTSQGLIDGSPANAIAALAW